MTNQQTLANFLKSAKKADNIMPITHTRIGDKNLNIYGGSYSITTSERLQEFYETYYHWVFENELEEYLTEKQDGKCLAIDLDFRYSPEVKERKHSSETIDKIISLYAEQLKEIYNFDSRPFNAYVMEKPNVNLTDGSLTKDGIHIIFGIKVPHELQLLLRQNVLKALKENDSNLFEDLPLTNTFESVLDEGISKGTTNWQLFGSRKPGYDAYQLTQVLEIELDPIDNEFMMKDCSTTINLDLFKRLSVQYDGNPEYKVRPDIKVSPILEKKKPAKKATNPETQVEQPASKLQELLMIIKIDKKDRATWMRVCSCIKYNNMTSDDWEAFCTNNELNWDTEKENLFDNIKTDSCLEICYLQSLAKNSGSTEYKQWLSKWRLYDITYEQAIDAFAASEVVFKSLKNTLVLCKEDWYMLNSENLWKKEKEPSYYILKEFHKYLDSKREKLNSLISESDDALKEINIKKLNDWLKLYTHISKPSYLSVLTKCLRKLLSDDHFAEKLDNNKGFLAFKNGIMDLKTKSFREGIQWCDFISDTIQYDYTPCDYDYVKSKLKPILNNSDEHLEYYLSIIGYSLIGDPELQKSIYFMIDKTDFGKGDNGKTFFFDILNTLMPVYVYRTKSSLIEINNTKVHKQLAMTKGKRIVWLEELPKEKNLNAALMKEIGDGKQIENEVMFGTSETLNIMWKMFALSNHIPKIDPNENAVFNRYKQVSFNSHFDRTGTRKEAIPAELKFIADPNLANEIKTERFNEVFSMIIDYAHKFYQSENKLPNIPAQFIKDTQDTQAMNDEFGSWFDENCIVGINKRVAEKSLVSSSGMSSKMVREGMERKGIKYIKDLKGIGNDEFNRPYRGGYKGADLSHIDEV